MKARTAILAIFCISLASCSSGPTVRMLEERANYQTNAPVLKISGAKRLPSKRAIVWVFPDKLPSGDIFGGAWLDVIIRHETWQL